MEYVQEILLMIFIFFKGALQFSKNKLFQSILHEMCAKKIKINCLFSKSLLLIITDEGIIIIQMAKIAVFYTMPLWRLKSENNRCDS